MPVAKSKVLGVHLKKFTDMVTLIKTREFYEFTTEKSPSFTIEPDTSLISI